MRQPFQPVPPLVRRFYGTSAPPAPTFYRAVNLGGAAETIDGNSWAAYNTAPNFSQNGYQATSSYTLIPNPGDAAKSRMLLTVNWNVGLSMTFTSVPNGTYDVYLWASEDDWSTAFGVQINGVQTATGLETGEPYHWARLSVGQVVVTGGSIVITITGGEYLGLCGVELWKQP